MERFSTWDDEMESSFISLPLEYLAVDKQSSLVDLVRRVDAFITNGDTYDAFSGE